MNTQRAANKHTLDQKKTIAKKLRIKISMPKKPAIIEPAEFVKLEKPQETLLIKKLTKIIKESTKHPDKARNLLPIMKKRMKVRQKFIQKITQQLNVITPEQGIEKFKAGISKNSQQLKQINKEKALIKDKKSEAEFFLNNPAFKTTAQKRISQFENTICELNAKEQKLKEGTDIIQAAIKRLSVGYEANKKVANAINTLENIVKADDALKGT